MSGERYTTQNKDLIYLLPLFQLSGFLEDIHAIDCPFAKWALSL